MTAVELFRTLPFQMRTVEDGGTTGTDAEDGLSLEGYAAVFGQTTRIDSWEGCFDETIQRGAFLRSLKQLMPVLQFDHGRHPMVGSIPLGSFTDLREDAQGLYVLARLHDNWLIEPVRDAIESKAVNGMSFRFQVVRDEWRDHTGKKIKPEHVAQRVYSADPSDPTTILTRTLLELRCPELGPVVFPAYAGTSVAVRSQDVSALLSDPALTRHLLATTPASSEPEGGSDERSGDTAPPAPSTRTVPSPQTRNRVLKLQGVPLNG
jgi:HK97 family phage prohead protease